MRSVTLLLAVAHNAASFASISRKQLVGLATTMGSALQDTSTEALKHYYQLVVDQHGGTSVVRRSFSQVEKTDYSNVPQYVRNLESDIAVPTGVVFTQLSGDNPWHHCPGPQIVVCLAGAWFVRTTDGITTTFLPGDVLYQDNTKRHPAAKAGTQQAQHYSGTSGGKPCDQMIVQLMQPDGPVTDSLTAKPPM